MVESIENAIIQRLKENCSGYQIESFPSGFDEFNSSSPKGCLLVRYQGSSFSENQAMDIIVQDEKIEFAILIEQKVLKNSKQAYPLLKKIKQVLTGFIPEGCTKMQPTKAEFIDEEFDVFWHGITFSLTRTTVESPDEENLVLLKKITVENNFGETEVYQ